MDSLRISVAVGKEYKTFVILNIEALLEKIKEEPRIAQIYKSMDKAAFIKWIEKGVTPVQFKTLQRLNDSI